jgi:hypothetical protein
MMPLTGQRKTEVCNDLRQEHGGNVTSAFGKETDYRDS